MNTSRFQSIFSILISFVVLACLLASPLGATPALAAPAMACSSSITVTSNADDGPGTLRRAIGDACLFAIINFDPGMSGETIHLASSLTIIIPMTIDGSALASQLTISGDSDSNGTADVGVFVLSTLNIKPFNATLDSLVITDGLSSFLGAGLGGAIYNSANINLIVKNSTISGNSATLEGGGIYNNGTLTLTNSTLSNNSSGSFGGGIYNDNGTLTLTNSTLSGNSANNGGGIYNDGGTLNYANTIIANSPGGDCKNVGSIPTNVNNLVKDSSCSTGGVNFKTGDPLFGSLGNYGGPTQTFPLLPASPAIDAGDGTVCDDNPGPNNLDQRGVARPAACDIGAFESRGFTMTKTGGDNQSAIINTNFNDLGLSVTSAFGEPVDGGRVKFTPPVSGASADVGGSSSSRTITSGVVSIFATANGINGSYNVFASAAGAASVSFALKNVLNPAKAITAFSFTSPTATGVVTEASHTIAITVPYGTDVTTLAPSITHTGASVSPVSGATQDFTSPVTYTVTAADSSTQDYTVTVTVALNPAKAITVFDFASPLATGVVTEASHTIAITVPYGTDVTTLAPSITHTGASVSPVSGATQDFTSPVTYTVTAADSSTQAYTVTVTVAADIPPVIAESDPANVIMSENASPTPFALTLHASDAENAHLTWSIAAPGASFGAASVTSSNPLGTAAAVHYTPLPNYNGTDSFIVRVSDGSLTDEITVNVTIQPQAGHSTLIWNQSYDIQYDTWLGVSNPGAFGGGYRSATSGTFTFQPKLAFTSIKWITYRGPDQGKAQVLVDGKVKATIDLYRATAQWQYPVTISGLTNAKHTIVIRAMNAKNPASSNKWVSVDGFKIGSTSYDDNKIYRNNPFSYGSWLGLLNPGARFGAYRISAAKNATIKFSFDGVKLTWTTARGPAYGKAAIYVDGVLKKTVDLYKASQQWNYNIVVQGLAYGHHDVIIKVLGTKNPHSTGTGILCDGFTPD